MNTITFGSLFSGIGGFDLGFERAGMSCAWQVEIDKNCQNILARHWPDEERKSDVKEVGNHNLKPVDLICGGFPCQDLSVAGRRAGLAGKRSGLWYQFHRIIAESKPRWVVIENVPGLLSSNQGRDFAVILHGLVECGYGVAWRILDAQYFGLAQRRRRVFIVGSLGDGRVAQVLFEREGGARDSPPRREAGERVAASLTRGASSSRGVNEPGRRREDDENLTIAFTERSRKGGRTFEAQKELSYALTNPGSGGRTHSRMIAFQQNTRDEVRLINGDGEIVGAISAEPGMKQKNYIARSLTSRNERLDADTENFVVNAFNGYTGGADDNDAQAGHIIAFDPFIAGSERTFIHRKDGLAQMSDREDAVAGAFGVRRLTPLECERLQGFQDGWTNGQSDSIRYRQLGNAVPPPMIEWIGKRIIAAGA